MIIGQCTDMIDEREAVLYEHSYCMLSLRKKKKKKVRIYCGKPYRQYRKVCGILCRITLYRDLLLTTVRKTCCIRLGSHKIMKKKKMVFQSVQIIVMNTGRKIIPIQVYMGAGDIVRHLHLFEWNPCFFQHRCTLKVKCKPWWWLR